MPKRRSKRFATVPGVPPHKRVDVTRAEFNRIVDLLNERGGIIDELLHNQEIQFKRIAQLQAELDELRSNRAKRS